MAPQLERKIRKLSVLALDQTTSLPIPRILFYAEVGVRSTLQLPPVQVDDSFDQAMRGALHATDGECVGNRQCWDRVAEVLREGLYRLLTAEARAELAADSDAAMEFLSRVIRRARDARAGATLLGLDIDMLRPLLDNALRADAEESGLELATPPALTPIAWAHPMGVLATDHAGYLSFDLARLPDAVYGDLHKAIAARRLDPEATPDTTIWVYPMAREEHRYDALEQGRFAHDAIVLKLRLDEPELPPLTKNFGFLAMQNPDLIDWRLSPASFATNPAALVGQDGCETLLPANVALHEFHFYQVIRLVRDARLDVPSDLQGKVMPGIVHEYRLSWYPLGHSLGQIIYSLPLAPGESVNLAVIDWSRRDEAQRTEASKLDEHLTHNQRRDRTITETVRAALGELQEGSSFMAGAAVSVGASTAVGAAAGSVVPGIGTAIGAAVGFLGGLAASIGGSSSDSSGSRQIASDTVQKLSENITQASAAMREFQSTIVVRSAQSEKEAVETRTVANYNHSHTLTVLYYEVLRHFRVVTALAKRRPAVLVKMRSDWFLPENIELTVLENRTVLQAALLNPKLAEGFDAIERAVYRKELALELALPSAAPVDPGEREFIYFTFQMTTGGLFCDPSEDDEYVDITAHLYRSNKMPVELWNRAKHPPKTVLSQRGAFREAWRANTFVAQPPLIIPPAPHDPVKWKDIEAISIGINFYEVDAVAFRRIKVTARDLAGVDEVLVDINYDDNNYDQGHLILAVTSDSVVLPTRRAPPPTPAAPRAAEEIADEVKKQALSTHLARYSAHYTRALALNENPAERARRLDEIKLPDGSSLLDHVENRPLEIIGEFVAYPCTDSAWSTKIREAIEPEAADAAPLDERLLTLPTRGVFAEAKLGHCNASEEIDNTRFWDWQTSPIPHFAPEIAAVQTVIPEKHQTDLSSTPFPQSLVNIVNPPNAPDPVGTAAALTLLGTPNIFRDMSGRAEVAGLLNKLSDNSVSMAQAATEARRIKSTYGDNLQGFGGSGAGPRAAPTQPSAANRDLQDTRKELQRAQDDGLITPEENQSLYKGAAARLAFGLDAESAGALGASRLSPSLDPGNFREFVDSKWLDLEIADVLRKLDVYPADSWAKQTASFAHHELKWRNLLALVKHTNVDKVKALISSTDAAKADKVQTKFADMDDFIDGFTVFDVGGPNSHKGYILLREDMVNQATSPGRPRMYCAVILAHELMHFRNREFFLKFESQTPSSSVFVNLTKAMAHREAAMKSASEFMQELICRHIEWRVQRDIMIFNQLSGVAPAAEDFKGFFRFALKIGRKRISNTEYLAQLTDQEFKQQVGMWMHHAGENSIFHDDPVKSAAVKKLFADTFDAVSPAFDEPNVPMWGQGISD